MTNEYPLVSYGILVDQELAAYLRLAEDMKHYQIPQSISDLILSGEFEDMAKNGTLPEEYSVVDIDIPDYYDGMAYCSSFFGQAEPVFSDQDGVSFDDDIICYIPTAKEPSLLESAYPSVEALAKEFKNGFREQHIRLPDDYDILAHIFKITGVYVC